MTPSQRVVDHNKRLCPKDVKMGIQHTIQYIIDNYEVKCND